MSRSTTATPRQLAYAKTLAEQTGTTFVMPTTAAQASREIKRLLALKNNSNGSALVNDGDDSQLSLAQETGSSLRYATEPAPGEIDGYGSTATWRHGASAEPPATDKQLSFIKDLAEKTGSPIPDPASRREASREIDRLLALATDQAPVTHEPRQVATYTIGAERRVLRTTALDGSVRLVDEPEEGTGERYVIERELRTENTDELDALIADYLAQARTLEAIPMATSAIREDLAA